MNRLSIYRTLLVIISLSSIAGASTACTVLEVGIERTPTPYQWLNKTVLAMETEDAQLETQIARPSPTPTPTPAPTSLPEIPTPAPSVTPDSPTFTNLRFATQPNGIPQKIFVAGTRRIYAIWDYANMSTGLTVHRIWKKNDEVWFDRSSAWDMVSYSSLGTIRDISIFDFDTGLQPGKYSLELEINGKGQTFGNSEEASPTVDFWVVPSEIDGPVTSPNKAYTAIVQWGGQITIEDPDGNLRDIVDTEEINEIAQLVWFPDSRHIAFTSRDRTMQTSINSDAGITHTLWVLDILNVERQIIGSNDENFHHPVISPGGNYMAVFEGATFVDACLASPALALIKLDSQYKRQAILKVDNFKGLPGASIDTIYPNTPDKPGYWKDNNILISSLSWTCATQHDLDGTYQLNLQKMEAQKLP
jgi:hypothetical protein